IVCTVGTTARPRTRSRLLRFGQADRLPDLGDLPRVVVPVVLEQRAHEGGNVDLLDSHDLLEERNARLALEVGLAQGVEVVHHVALLALERGAELLEGHGLAVRRHLGVSRIDVTTGRSLVAKVLRRFTGFEPGSKSKWQSTSRVV